MKGKTIRKLTAEQYIKIPVITWRNYREETRHESNPHLAPRLPWTSMNMLSKSWEIPHLHGLTIPSNTIKIPHIAPHRPGVGGVGVSIDKCIRRRGTKIKISNENNDTNVWCQRVVSVGKSITILFSSVKLGVLRKLWQRMHFGANKKPNEKLW